MESNKSSVNFMLSVYNVKLAYKIKEDILNLAQKYCFGCEVGHPSQDNHTCILWTNFEQLESHFEEALINVNLKEVLDMWHHELNGIKKGSKNFKIDISDEQRQHFIKLLENEQWCRINLPKPDRLRKDVDDSFMLSNRL